MADAILSGTKALVADQDLKSQLIEKGYGEQEGSALALSLIEAAHLLKKEKLKVKKGRKSLDYDGFLAYCCEKEDDFFNKHIVYSDLRDRGMVVRTGLKFGTDFRLYDRGAKVGKAHSKYLVHVVAEEYTCSFPEMAGRLRLAKNVNKDMIYAVVDEESDITYYLVDRMRL